MAESPKHVFEGVVADGERGSLEQDYQVEDGGHARIQTFSREVGESPDAESGLFVRLQSWDDDGEHRDWKNLAGKKVRITVEEIEEGVLSDLDKAVDLLNQFYFNGEPRTQLHNTVFDFLKDIGRGPTIKRSSD